MTPENTGRQTALYSTYPTKTYGMDLGKKRIYGYYQGTEAMCQAVYKMLATVRFEEIIYSDSYGTELMDCMGRLTPYVWSEIEHTVTEALLTDDRIISVEDFNFTEDRKSAVLRVSFVVKTTVGDFAYTKEVLNYV